MLFEKEVAAKNLLEVVPKGEAKDVVHGLERQVSSHEHNIVSGGNIGSDIGLSNLGNAGVVDERREHNDVVILCPQDRTQGLVLNGKELMNLGRLVISLDQSADEGLGVSVLDLLSIVHPNVVHKTCRNKLRKGGVRMVRMVREVCAKESSVVRTSSACQREEGDQIRPQLLSLFRCETIRIARVIVLKISSIFE